MRLVLGRRGIVAVLAAVALLEAAGCGSSGSSGQSSGGGGGQKASSSGGGQASQGAKLFASNGCSGCHTLKRAGSTGTTGPNLDTNLKADAKRAGKPLRAFVHQ